MLGTRSIATLADFRDTGRTIRAYCTHYYACSHDAQLRLELLALHFGWHFDFYTGREQLAGRLYCTICGWYHPTFLLGHANGPTGFAGSHSAGFALLPPDQLARLEQARQAASSAEIPWVGQRKGGRKFGR